MAKYKLTLHYSVQNGGDGSAYPQFSLSKELVEIDQEIMNELHGEGWGEECTGEITLESDSEITVPDEELSITKESVLEDLEGYLDGGYYKDPKIAAHAKKLIKRVEKL